MNNKPYDTHNSEVIYTTENNEEIVSIDDWLLSMFILLIPGVNIIAIVLWAACAKNKSKQNFFIALLLLILIFPLLLIVIAIVYKILD